MSWKIADRIAEFLIPAIGATLALWMLIVALSSIPSGGPRHTIYQKELDALDDQVELIVSGATAAMAASSDQLLRGEITPLQYTAAMQATLESAKGQFLEAVEKTKADIAALARIFQ